MKHASHRACSPSLLVVFAATLATLPSAFAAVPGISGTHFELVATEAYTSQPDGASIYSWGYGCAASYSPNFAPPAASVGATCPTMQSPGPTLIVNEGDTVSVTLTDLLPRAAGNTSIVFPGFNVVASSPSQPATCPSSTAVPTPAGIVATEAAPGCAVTYTFTATKPGTYSYYSGTQADLQIEMGMFGAIIVVPRPAPGAPAASCTKAVNPFSLAPSAYDNSNTCYDREYLFQFSEMDIGIHQQVEAGKDGEPGSLNIATDPYRPQYFLVNGRSMPDDMDTPYAMAYPHQPYNGNPHMHPGDLVLMRIIEQGRMQHPFHFHGNHARVLARDGNLILSPDGGALAGPLLFTTPTVPGQTQDQIFTWTGQGLNWDVYGRTQAHTCNGITLAQAMAPTAAVTQQLAGKNAAAPQYTSPFDPVTSEWCPDHGKDIPVAPPDPQAVANGLWYGGTPYLGLQSSNPTPLPPAAVVQNANAGYAYMWHSHNEREITTNNVFPGGLMMMLIIDPPSSPIDENQ